MLKDIRAPVILGLSLVMSLVLLVSCSGGLQTLMLEPSPEELTEEADAIVLGTVVGTDSYWNGDHTGIYSEVLVSVHKSEKGPLAGSAITVIVPGGTVGQITQCLSDTPRFAEGQTVRLFLNQLPPEGLAEQGLEGSRLAVQSSQLYVLCPGKPNVTQNTIGGLFPFQLEEQGARILNQGRDSSGGLQTEGSSITLEESGFVYYDTRWFGDWPVVNYVVNAPDGDSNTAVQNAGCTWGNASARFSFNYTGTHSRTDGFMYNGINEVLWCDLGAGGGLGRAAWWTQGYQIIEADIEFNSYYTWSTATPTPLSAVDVETVALHEFGHWLSLGHSDVEQAIMYPWYKGTQRTLHDDDIAGIQYIYGAVPSYTISGTILDVGGAPVQGISVVAAGGHEQAVATDEYGVYTMTSVLNGTVDITITPSKLGYTFDPVSRTIEGPVEADVVSQNFTAMVTVYTISGTILDVGGTPMQGASVAATDGHYQIVTTDEYGVYDLTGVLHGAVEILITPSKLGYTFDPVSHTVEGPMEADLVNQNFTALTVVSKDRIGIYRPDKRLFALDMNEDIKWTTGVDVTGVFGVVGDEPIIGDWNGNGRDEIGIYRPGTSQFALDMNGNGVWDGGVDQATSFGVVGDAPIIGDWNGDGKDEIGIYRPSQRVFVLDVNGDVKWTTGVDATGTFGLVGDAPIIGDWNGDGNDEIGIYRPSQSIFALDMNGDVKWTTGVDVAGAFGLITDEPIIGDWNGDGRDEIGIYRPSQRVFVLDMDGDVKWTTEVDATGKFGLVDDEPITGRW